MTQDPKKWHIGQTPWKVKLKGVELTKEKDPTRQDQRIKESPVERTGLEIPGTCSTTKVGLRKLERGTKKNKKRRTDMSFSKTQ